MKSKPNTEQFKPKKDPTAFLESGVADASERTKFPKNFDYAPPVQITQPIASNKVHREQKIFRLSLDLINTLKRESYERSLKTGSRVTETELVEQALRSFFNIDR